MEVLPAGLLSNSEVRPESCHDGRLCFCLDKTYFYTSKFNFLLDKQSDYLITGPNLTDLGML